MTKLAFVCTKGLDTFVEPVAREFELLKQKYHVRRFYVQTQQEIVAAVKWADVVWIEWANESAILATQVYDLRKRGVICRLHSYEAFSNMPERVDWSVVDFLVLVAPHMLDIIKRRIPDIEEKVAVKLIPNGVNLMECVESMRDGKGDDTGLDIAFACSINHKKGPMLALQIMAELVKVNPEYRLHSAGAFQLDDRYEVYMKHMVKAMGIEENVIFHGHVNDMPEFWRGKKWVLSTSSHEGHPLNVLEAMARGIKPVIHNFYGADQMYPPEMLFNTVAEAVDIITSEIPDRKKLAESYRLFMIDRGWTFGQQMDAIKELVKAVTPKGE